jgi:hypothetical protein
MDNIIKREREKIDLDAEMPENENLEQTTIEDIVLTRILDQKPSGVITRSRSIRIKMIYMLML